MGIFMRAILNTSYATGTGQPHISAAVRPPQLEEGRWGVMNGLGIIWGGVPHLHFPLVVGLHFQMVYLEASPAVTHSRISVYYSITVKCLSVVACNM